MELAPGFYVDDLVPPGSALRFQVGMFWGHAGPVVALHPHDWERLPGDARERLLDELTRANAERGLRLTEAELAKAAA